MKNNFPKIQFLLSLALLLLLAGAFIFFYRYVNLKNQEAQELNFQAENETSRREEAKLLNLSINSIKEEETRLDTHFARGSDIVPFLDTIEALAPQAGAKAETSSVDVAKDNDGLLVKVEATGSFESLYKFLTLLENSPYELQFLQVDLSKKNETEAPITAEDGTILPQAPSWHGDFEIRLLSFTP